MSESGFFAESGGLLSKEQCSCRQNPKTRLTQKIQDSPISVTKKFDFAHFVPILAPKSRVDFSQPFQDIW